MTSTGHRSVGARIAAPVAFLLVVTVALLLVRSAVREDPPAGDTTTPVVAPDTSSTFHVIATGDTLAAIAERYDTSVDRLVELNPDVDPVALVVGDRLRVR